MRASDQEREAIVDVLRDAYAAGRLNISEVLGRADAAYSARTWGDLRRLVADLPPGADVLGQDPRQAGPRPAATTRPAAGPRPGAPARRRPELPLIFTLAWLVLAAATWAPTLAGPLMLVLMSALAAACRETRIQDRPPRDWFQPKHMGYGRPLAAGGGPGSTCRPRCPRAPRAEARARVAPRPGASLLGPVCAAPGGASLIRSGPGQVVTGSRPRPARRLTEWADAPCR